MKVDADLCKELARKLGSSTMLFESEARDAAAQLTAAADLAERTKRDERIHAQERIAVESGWVELDHPAHSTLTEERARKVVREAAIAEIRADPDAGMPFPVADAIATRAAKELAGAVVDQRASRLPSRVLHMLADYKRKLQAEPQILPGYDQTEQEERRRWLAEQIKRIDALFAEQELEVTFDRAAVAVTGKPAAELSERLTIESRSYPSAGYDGSDEVAAIGERDGKDGAR